MGEFSIWHWLVVLVVVMLLFGGGKVSGLMGDLAKGIKSFKAVMAEDDGSKAPKPQTAPPSLAAAAPAGPVVTPAAAPAQTVAAQSPPVEANAARAPAEHTS